jgi:Flp pilus assembly protein TadG
VTATSCTPGRRTSQGWCRLLADRRGSSAVDFALIASPFFLLVVGVLELSMVMIAQVLLQSAVSDASRFGLTGRTLEGRMREEVIATIVEEDGIGLIDPEHLVFETLVYPSFDSVGQPETFTDSNGNGTWDAGEAFADINGNGQWDADMGAAGLGGPDDVVLYRVRYDWRMLTPLLRHVLPNDGVVALEASLAIRNEPFPAGGGP